MAVAGYVVRGYIHAIHMPKAFCTRKFEVNFFVLTPLYVLVVFNCTYLSDLIKKLTRFRSKVHADLGANFQKTDKAEHELHSLTLVILSKRIKSE